MGTSLTEPPVVDIETLFLPLSRGYGNIKSLHYAMTEDAGLKAKIEGLITTTSFSTLNSQIVSILYDWAGVDGVSSTGRGVYMDARILTFMETLTDTPYYTADVLHEYTYPQLASSASDMTTAWAKAFTELKGRLLAQSTFADILGPVSYEFSTDALSFSDTLSAVLARATASRPTDSTQALWFWRELGGILVRHAGEFGLTEAQVKTQLDAAAGTKVQLFDAYLANSANGEKFVGSGLADYFLAGAGNDDVEAFAGDDSVDGGTGLDSIKGGDGNDTLLGGDGNDMLWGDAGDNRLLGGAGDDTLYGGGQNSGRNTLLGGDGNDTLITSSTYPSVASSFDGGNGNDRLTGSDGGDTMLGGAGEDTLTGRDGNDQMDGGTEDDLFYGGNGNDTQSGGTGDDTLRGDAGADRLIGGAGADSLTGGGDADLFVYLAESDSTAALRDRITDFEKGVDKIDLSAIPAITGFGALTIALSGSYTLVSFGSSFQIRVNGDFTQGANAFAATDFVFSSITGTSGNDSLTGTAASETINGLAGNDTLRGGAGADTLLGGDGTDKLYGDDGADRLTGGAGIDTFHYTIAQVSSTRTSVDTITDFGNGADLIDFTDLTLSNLHGTGVTVQKGSATTALGANTGLFISSTTAAGFSVAQIEAAINKAGDDLGADIMYAMVSNNTDTVLVKVRDADNDNNLTDAGDIQFVATLTGMNTAALNALTTANFVDW